jgi:hypothetical protein
MGRILLKNSVRTSGGRNAGNDVSAKPTLLND